MIDGRTGSQHKPFFFSFFSKYIAKVHTVEVCISSNFALPIKDHIFLNRVPHYETTRNRLNG